MNNSAFVKVAAYRAMDLLNERRALISPDGIAFWAWPREDRLILIFDPAQIDLRKLNDVFAHELSTRLSGRRVKRTNSRGLYLQVGYEIPLAPTELVTHPLDLTQQLSPWHMPIGNTQSGPLWLSLIEGDSFFVTGLRGMGKTGELHGMIQALLAGGETLVYAWDGKEHAEYLRYVGRPNFTLLPMDGLQAGLESIQKEATARMRTLAMSGHPNIQAYNAAGGAPILPIALIIDEVAEVEDQALLLKQVKVNRAAGVHPIFATNDPSKSSVVAKSNLGTRISFKVASSSDSMMGLGRPGANRLPSVRGRGLIERDGRLVEFQSFVVDYPKPSAEGMQWLAEQMSAQADAPLILPTDVRDEISQLAESIREAWNSTMSKREVGRLLGKTYAGGWTAKIDKVISYLSATTTTESAQNA